MKGPSQVPVLVAGLVVLALAASAPAQQEIFNGTFDVPNDHNYTYFYDYAGGGNPQTDHSAMSSATSTVTGGGGRGGGNAFALSGDFTTVPTMPDYNYKGLGGGVGFFRFDFPSNTALGLPSGNLADYTLSVDLSAAGFTEPATPVRIALQLQVKDDRFTPDADTNMDPFAVINFTAPVSTQYSTATFRLDQGMLTFDQTRVPEANRDFSAHATDIGLINPDFAAELNWGADADNRLFIDNVRLTVVPEPASALLLAGLALLASRRPRRSRR